MIGVCKGFDACDVVEVWAEAPLGGDDGIWVELVLHPRECVGEWRVMSWGGGSELCCGVMGSEEVSVVSGSPEQNGEAKEGGEGVFEWGFREACLHPVCGIFWVV